MLRLQNFIDGELVDPVGGNYFSKKNPSTGKDYAEIPDSDAADVNQAVAAAKAAFPAWSALSPQKRADLMRRLADLIDERTEELAIAESKDQGKPVSLARTVDIPRSSYNLRFFAGAVLHHEDTSTMIEQGPGATAVNFTVRSPVGVAGLISPWNLPLYLLTWKIAPAIAVGNTVVCKPSEFTSVTAWMFCDILKKSGIPKGVVNIVFGTGPKAGSALVSHPDVPLISFTGGTKTGEVITQLSAPLCKKVSLELGGKNPNIIFADADLSKAVATTIRSSFANQGEICLCGSRIFVQDKVFDQFLEAFVNETKKLVVGDPADPKTTTGALVNEDHYNKVKYYINLAKEEGGKIVLGGPDRPEGLPDEFKGGYFLSPTIIVGLPPVNCRVQQEEIFGPVVTVTPFSTEEEVITWANSVKYGLSASVWTESMRAAHRVALALQTGTVWVNSWMLRDLRVPFGGVKQSGIGREGGNHSIDFYTESKTVCMQFN